MTTGINMNLQQGIEETEAMINSNKIEQKQSNIPEETQTKETQNKPKTASKRSQSKNSTLKEKKDENEANTTLKKQVFSFRAEVENVISWKAYATATGQTMEILCTAAMNEYLTNHTLTGNEQIIFEAMKKRDKNK